MNTLKDAAQAAIDVQSACNLSGVVHSFSKAMTILRAHPECTGTDWANRHPVAVLFAIQIGHLSGIGVDVTDYNKHYEECERLAKEEDEAPTCHECEAQAATQYLPCPAHHET